MTADFGAVLPLGSSGGGRYAVSELAVRRPVAGEATALADRLVELVSKADEGQVVRVHIAKGGPVGMSGLTVAAELREEVEGQ